MRPSRRKNITAGLAALGVALFLAATAQGASGPFERLWGKDVDMGGATGFEICVLASSCQGGSEGVLGGEMDAPRGVATDAFGNVYLVEQDNRRIQKFDSSGNFQRAWGEDVISGNMNTGFEICVAANGDTCKQGTFAGAALGGEMLGPESVATDAAGSVYVTDAGHGRVQRFDSSGNFQLAWGEDVASSGPGNTGTGFEICQAANGDICKTGETMGAALIGEIAAPTGIAFDAAGNVYVADRGHNRIQKFDPEGIPLRAWGEDVISGNVNTGFEICRLVINACKIGETTAPALGGEMNLPIGVATDAGGNVYVSEASHHRIQKFDSSGNFQRAWGEDVVDTGPGDTMADGFEICVAGADTCKTGVTTAPARGGEMNMPAGLATDAAGSLYLADFGHFRIQKFDSSGNFQRAWGGDVVDTGPGDTMDDGFEICVKANGDICKIAALAFPLSGGELGPPTDVATDSIGSLYVADFALHRIQKFAGDPVAAPPPAGGGTTPTATPTTQPPPKRCKKGRKLKKGKCVRKKRKRR
jgi:DNA-binding beta-propeller fold protein YncE